MNPIKWLENKLFFGNIINDYGVIGKSDSMGKTEVSACISKKDGSYLLVLKGKHSAFLSMNVQYYKIALDNVAISKLAKICVDAKKIVEKRISDLGEISNNILENGEVPLKCTSCETPFRLGEQVCSKCLKNLDRESEMYKSGDRLGYIELYQECHI